MIIITSSEHKVKSSKYYDENECWDYPLEELNYLKNNEKELYDITKIYLLTEKNRLYETNCTKEEIINLINEEEFE